MSNATGAVWLMGSVGAIAMPGLLIELAFFSGDDLLCRGSVCCGAVETADHFEGAGGHHFDTTSRFDLPASPVEIICRLDGKRLYQAALRVGVHTSDDWESIDLANIHTLAF